ncbi:MAG: hypothetical protein JW829_08905, partial [Pirellulales bacterium]|nr:hypothetical protein [Pirellulales bacterium]
DESGVGTSLTTIPVVLGQTYRLVAAIDFDGDELRLWVNPNSSDFDEGTGSNSADVTRAYTGTNWSTAVRLASGAETTWDNLIVATEFSELNLPAADVLTLRVNTTTGAVSMRNDSGASIDINGYAILSAGGALNASGWNSFQEQDLVSFPAGDGTGNGWEETGIPDSGYLGEAFLLGNSTFADQFSIDLGSAFRPTVFGQNNDGDLVFNVRLADGGILDGLVEYVTGGVVNDADFNGDGNVDGTDFLTWQIGFGTTGTASRVDGDANNDTNVDGADLAIWRSQFGTVGLGTGGLAGMGIPEPATCVLAILGLFVLILGWIRNPMHKSPA